MIEAKVRVRKAHQPESGRPLHLQAGDLLRYERRETPYAGWIWCTDSGGDQAWVPENWVAIQGDQCQMQREYFSIELRIQLEDMVRVLEVESGWAWVEHENGLLGWVPLECLEELNKHGS